MLTAQLKAWLVANSGIKADAADDVFEKAWRDAMAKDTLSAAKFVELTTPADAAAANGLQKMLADLGAGIAGMNAALANLAKGNGPAAGTDKAAVDANKDAAASADKDKGTDKDKGANADKDKGSANAGEKRAWHGDLIRTLTRTGAYEGDTMPTVHVRGAWEQYGNTKAVMMYPTHTKSGRPHLLAGRPVLDFTERGRAISSASDLDKAVSGAFAKFLISSSQRGQSRMFGFQSLPNHDKELLLYAMNEMEWGGSSDGGDFADIQGRKLTPNERKALIDDATSGGLEAAPIVFDDLVIQAPLLHSELYQLVNTIPLDRGRRVEGVSTGTVTGTWGGVDDTAIALFNTASYVSAFDTTIFRWQGAIRIGLDFLSDTPIDFGQHITAQYGERLLEDLDDVVATGNGTTQPEGVMTKSGTTSINFAATTTLGNYESLRFGVAKPEHRANLMSSAVFCGTETSYTRARAIPVGASDARRLGGMDYSSYSWMERPYKINQSLTNAQIFYAILAKYRMYRRRGLTMRTSTEGDTLIRANELLIVAMARYGGQLERGACAAVTTTAPV